ncbi:MAG: DUF4383 domain-containing protein [Actinomycetota bacterium]
MTLNRGFGYIFGAVYVLVGAVGFAITSGVEFAATEGKNLLFFEVNPLHNIIHLAVGALLIGGAAAGAIMSRRVNLLVGVVYLLVGALGLFLVGNEFNILALNHPDNGLHFATALLAIAVSTAESARGAPRGSMAAQS